MKKSTLKYLTSLRYNPLVKFKVKIHKSKKDYKRISKKEILQDDNQ